MSSFARDQANFRRAKANEWRKKDEPQPLSAIDWTVVLAEADFAIVQRTSGVVEIDDTPIFEAVMTAVYGPDVWKWWNREEPDDDQ